MSEGKELVVSAGRIANLDVLQVVQAFAPFAKGLGLRVEHSMLIMMTGYELGFGYMESLRLFFAITTKNGVKIGATAQSMNATIRKSRILETFDVIEKDDGNGEPESCTVKMLRVDGFGYEYTFSMKDAIRAELDQKPNWKHYPKDMMRARAIAACARALCPDVLAGLYLADELGAITNREGKPTGEIIDVTPQVIEQPKAPPVTVEPQAVESEWTLGKLMSAYSANQVIEVNDGKIPATNDECARIAQVLGMIAQYGSDAVEQANDGEMPTTQEAVDSVAYNIVLVANGA